MEDPRAVGYLKRKAKPLLSAATLVDADREIYRATSCSDLVQRGPNTSDARPLDPSDSDVDLDETPIRGDGGKEVREVTAVIEGLVDEAGGHGGNTRGDTSFAVADTPLPRCTRLVSRAFYEADPL